MLSLQFLRASRPASSASRTWNNNRHRRCLQFTAGDRSRTAQLLGIGRTTLYRKIKRYKLA